MYQTGGELTLLHFAVFGDFFVCADFWRFVMNLGFFACRVCGLRLLLDAEDLPELVLCVECESWTRATGDLGSIC